MRRADFDPEKVMGRSGYVTAPREGDRETRVKAAKRAYETERAEEILGRAPETHPAPFDCWAFIPKMLKKMQDPHLAIDLSQEELAHGKIDFVQVQKVAPHVQEAAWVELPGGRARGRHFRRDPSWNAPPRRG